MPEWNVSARGGHRAMCAGLFVLCAAGCTMSNRTADRAPAARKPAVLSSASTAPEVRVESVNVLSRRAWQTVIQVDALDQAAVQRALDAARGPAIVVIPAGRITIVGTLEIRGDDVLVVGAGAGSMTLGDSAAPQATVLARAEVAAGGDDDASHVVPMIRARGRQRVQLSGIRFEGSASEGSKTKDVGILVEDGLDFRVDHCFFAHMGFAGVRVNGESRGVIDHSSFYAEYKSAIGTEGYGVAVYGTNAIAGLPMGGASADPRAAFAATFVEDSAFSLCRHSVTANKGARYVFRRNHVTNGVIAHAADAHGTEYASEIGTEWIDVYDNTIEQSEHKPPFYDGWAVRVRGGQGLVHDNVIRGYSTGVELSALTTQTTGPVYVWNNTLAPAGGTPVHVRASKHHAAPTFALAPPAGYVAHAYPHPLTRSSCGAAPRVVAGWSSVCASDAK